jgi:hypothetical protein
MSNSLNNIFSETDCLSSEILIAYAEDRIEADEKYLVEKHLLDCTLCSDALEGISSLKDKSKLKPILVEISKKIDGYSKGRKTKVIYFNFRRSMAAAAVLVVLVGVTFIFRFYLLKQDKDMVAERTVKESKLEQKEKDKIANEQNNQPDASFKSGTKDEKVTEETKKSDIVENAEEQMKGADDNITYLPKGTIVSNEGTGEAEQNISGYFRSNYDGNFALSDSEKDSVSVVSKDQDVTLALDKSENRLEEADQKNEVTVVSETKTNAPNAIITNTTTATGSNNNKSTVLEKSDKKDTYKEKNYEAPVVGGNTGVADEIMDQRYADGLQLYQGADYSGCLTQMQSYITDAPDDLSAYYYCGVSQYFLAQYDSAITSLSKVLKDKKSSFYETAQWYLALSYIWKSDTSEAEKTLKAIVKAKGSFKTQAEEKLNEIKK